MRQRVLITALTIFYASITVFGQKPKIVSGTYIYMVPETQSYSQAKETAIQKAKIQILADTFGTVMDVSTTTSITSSDAQLHTLSLSQVKGEWLETIGDPEITKYFDGDKLSIKVEIKGKVREIISASSDYTSKVLCGVPDIRFENDSFISGDDLFLYFQSSGDGYLAVYLYDGVDDVYCLLPYRRQSSGIYQVKGGTPYIFFSSDFANDEIPYDWIDEYTLTASSDLEMNRVYVVFSPNRFTKATDNTTSSDLPRELSFVSFQKWLSRIRMEDRELSVKSVDISIKKAK